MLPKQCSVLHAFLIWLLVVAVTVTRVNSWNKYIISWYIHSLGKAEQRRNLHRPEKCFIWGEKSVTSEVQVLLKWMFVEVCNWCLHPWTTTDKDIQRLCLLAESRGSCFFLTRHLPTRTFRSEGMFIWRLAGEDGCGWGGCVCDEDGDRAKFFRTAGSSSVACSQRQSHPGGSFDGARATEPFFKLLWSSSLAATQNTAPAALVSYSPHVSQFISFYWDSTTQEAVSSWNFVLNVFGNTSTPKTLHYFVG